MKILVVATAVMALLLSSSAFALSASDTDLPLPLTPEELAWIVGSGEICVGLIIGASLGLLFAAASMGSGLLLIAGAYGPVASALC